VRPIGVHRIPESSAELKKAIEHVLEFLVSFHKYESRMVVKPCQLINFSAGCVHRDLRWPNILYNTATNSYFVIDFETAAESGKYLNYIFTFILTLAVL
jgi:hypothetical protein